MSTYTGWYQVSRKYRTIARLKPGVDLRTAAIEWAHKHLSPWSLEQATRWVDGLMGRGMLDFMLRMEAHPNLNSKYVESLELTPEEFDDFRQHGGGTAF